jgi:hypothetical protein
MRIFQTIANIYFNLINKIDKCSKVVMCFNGVKWGWGLLSFSKNNIFVYKIAKYRES